MPRRRTDFRKILQTLTAANVDRTLAAMSEETRRRFVRDVQCADEETFERFNALGWLDRHPECRGRGDEGLAVDLDDFDQ
ncbi:hypothetical protein AKJ09_11234 [Labilithrix luteola]|uniref:Uncharacterized protein n=1 Tax=Labilithrix luteola TaxID=1391654 RepID=A0A0K1QFL6_9BACT|nr:hypothetical protein [Labilithrix luteola]AKV04571.1 hypothetical protein AKJ09_11234 [Labilithrix luteola]